MIVKNYKQVGIVYLSYHAAPYLPDFLESLRRLDYPFEKITVYIVDNPHPDFGSMAELLNRTFLPPYQAGEIPRVVILPQTKNLGFAGGNNVGFVAALKDGADYVIAHNDDGFFADNAISRLIETMESDKSIALLQPLVCLYPQKDLVNSAGNAFHLAGFGYSIGYAKKITEISNQKTIREIPYATGAALVIRRDFLVSSGGFDEDFFMYHEDLTLSIKARFDGLKVMIDERAIFYHKYSFVKSIQKFYLMERNRYAFLLLFYKLPTLILLLPLLVATDIGLFLFSIRGQWFRKWLDVHLYWLNPKHVIFWLKKRKVYQRDRKIGDRELIFLSTGRINFQEKNINNSFVNMVANPVISLYRKILTYLVRW